MSLADFAPAHRIAFSFAIAGLGRILAQWIATRRVERAQEAALRDLLFAPEHRLRDLGIRREQLIMAMEIHRK